MQLANRHVFIKQLALSAAAGLLCHCSSKEPSGASSPAGEISEGAPGMTQAPADPLIPGSGMTQEPGTGAPTTPTPSEGNPNVQGNLVPAEPVATPEVPAEVAPPVTEVPATPPFAGSFIMGADISGVQEAIEAGAVFVDTDGVQKSILSLLQAHGFNYIRLRTFVDPTAPFGYAAGGNGCGAKAEAYNDRNHTIEFAQAVKAAGMGFLLDFHYSDTWADPGKQVIPEAWRGLSSVALLAAEVQAYTVDVMTALVAAGARPDMVQVGNEITPGMLIHVPTANTDCYGNDSVVNPGVNGSANNWDNLAELLRAGVAGVKQVDPEIAIMLHIENTESAAGVGSWIQNAQTRGVAFDVLGLSAYETFQGPSGAWEGTLSTLTTRFPELSFAIAEYNPQRRLVNDITRELPNAQGVGTFFWEPTLSGEWGNSMFDRQGNRYTARAADFAEYDRMRADFGL